MGTVVPAPSGRIPTHLFTSEPSLDKFEWNQSMIGFRFETTIDPSRSRFPDIQKVDAARWERANSEAQKVRSRAG